MGLEWCKGWLVKQAGKTYLSVLNYSDYLDYWRMSDQDMFPACAIDILEERGYSRDEALRFGHKENGMLYEVDPDTLEDRDNKARVSSPFRRFPIKIVWTAELELSLEALSNRMESTVESMIEQFLSPDFSERLASGSMKLLG